VRTRLVPFAALALTGQLALTACSSGSGGDQALEAPTSTPTATADVSAPVASQAPTGRSTPSPASAATADTTTTAPTSAPPVAPLSTKAPGTVAAQKATAPGTYTLDDTGTVTLGNPGTPQDASGTTTLTVGALTNGVQHSSLHSDSTGDTEEDLLVRSTGTYVASLKLSSPAFTKELRPSPAVLLVPDPATVGSAWSWQATSTDGKTHAAASNRIGSTQTLVIGGTKVVCAVVQTHLVLTGDVDYTTDLTTYWSPDYRLPVKTHSTGKGSYNGFPFSTDITSTMRSVKAS
jgi:hypothetical protein